MIGALFEACVESVEEASRPQVIGLDAGAETRSASHRIDV
jgi:hypothetical protein